MNRISCLVIMALVVCSSVCSPSATDLYSRTTLDRASRLLQSNNYEIKPSPDINVYCDDQGVKADELAIDLAKRDEEQKKIEGRFPAVVEAFNSGGSSNYGGLVNKMVGGALGASIVFAVLSLLSLKFLFWWSICECCCKKTCCLKQQAEGEKRGKGRLICWILGAAFGVVVIIMTIVWVSQLGKVAKRAKDIKCGIAILHSDIVYGTKLEGGGKFIGINGLDSMLGEYISLMDSIASIKTDAANVQGQSLNTKASTMETKYNSFKSSFNPADYKFKGTDAALTQVVPNVATAIKAAADSALGEEVKLLKGAAEQIHNAVTEIANFDSSAIDSSKKTLQDIKSSLGTTVKEPIDNIYKSIVTGGSDYIGSIQSASKAMIAVSIVVVVVFTLLYLLILFCTAKLNKCHKLKCLSKIIMLVQLLVGFVILIFAIIGTIISVVLTVVCSVIHGSITTENYLSTHGLADSDPLINKLMNECIWRNGKGDLMAALGSETTTFDKLNTITDGIQQFKDISSNLTSQSSPYLGGGLMKQVDDSLAFSTIDRGLPESADLKSGYDSFNNHQCSQDIMRGDAAPATYTASTTGDSSTAGLGSKYSILLSAYPTHNYAGRYSGAVTCASGDKAAAQGVLVRTLDSATDFTTKVTTTKTDYNTNFYGSELDVFTTLKTAIPQLNNILDKVDGALNALKSIDGSFKSVADCTVFRKEILLLENIICFRVGNDFYIQNNLAIALGALIFAYSWCMCCGIRLSNKQEGQKQNEVGPNSNYDQVNDKSMANDKSGILNNPKSSPSGGRTPGKPGDVEYI